MSPFLDDPAYRKVMNMVYHFHDLGKYERAITYARKAIGLRPDGWEGYSWLAGLMVLKRKDEVALPEEKPELFLESLAPAERGVELMPDYTFTWETLGWVKKYLLQYDQAARCYRKALALKPKCPYCRVTLAECLIKAQPSNKKPFVAGKVLKLYEESVRLNTTPSGAFWVEWGYVFECMNDLARAERYYRRALRVNPLESLALSNLGELALAKGDSAKAEGLFRKALAIKPGHPRYRWNLTRLPSSPLVTG